MMYISAVKWILLFFIFVAVNCQNIIESDNCEAYYYLDYNVVFCIIYKKENIPSFNERVLKDSCDDTKTKLFYDERGSLMKLQHLYNGLCTLKPLNFDFLSPLNIHSFTSISNNTILKNNTFYGICKLKYIDLSKNSIKIIQPNAFNCITEIIGINLSKNLIEFLLPSIFKGMKNLERLQLDENYLRTLPSEIFDDLVSLKDLRLQANSISFLPKDLFYYLQKLQYLELDKNNLELINYPLLYNLKELRDLSLSNNKIKILKDSFLGNEKLNILVLSYNAELILNNDSFSGLTGLTKLYPMGCNIHSIPSGLFQKTPNISYIYLDQNNIKLITPETFQSLDNLIQVDLPSNRIFSLENQPFKYSKNLKTIDLSGNEISELKLKDFQGLSILEDLDLSSNNIKQIEDESFKELPNLLNLYLQNNSISSLHTSLNESIFKNIKNVETLILSKNKLKRLTGIFRNNQKLVQLYIANNPQLVLDNDSFAGLEELEGLYMYNCNINSLPKDIFLPTPNLSLLMMYNNSLTNADLNTLKRLEYLEELDLSFNTISELTHQPFKNNTYLKYINLEKNNLNEIRSDSFSDLYYLTELNLSWNLIKNVPCGTFDDLHMLESFKIRHNLLTSLPMFKLFRNMTKLKIIDASGNHLYNFKEIKLNNLLELEMFDVSNNYFIELFLSSNIITQKSSKIFLKYNYIHKISFDDSENIQEFETNGKTQVYMKENPLNCDCHAYNFYENKNRSVVLQHIKFVDGLICKQPPENRGKELSNIKPSDFTCNTVDFCPKNCICIYTAFDRAQSVNCSNKHYRNLPSIAPSNTSILHFRFNNLKSLINLNESLWENLTELYVENNEITSEEFFIPNNLKILDLRGNNLSSIPKSVTQHASMKRSFRIMLSNNSWPCDCSILPFKSWLSQHIIQVSDSNDIRCLFRNKSMSTVSLTSIDDFELCPLLYIPAYLIGILLALIISCILIFYFKFKLHILAFLYTYCNCIYLLICCDSSVDDDKMFDCFIAYCSEDRDVTLAVITELEGKQPYYKFCIHERNWMPGRYITNNIVLSVQNSRKTLIVLSEAFLKSEWFYMEFQAAYRQTLQDKKDRLIIVLKGNLPDMRELDEDVRYVISWKTYLVWNERWFWEKLRYAIHDESSLRNKIYCVDCNTNCQKSASKNNDICLDEIVSETVQVEEI